MHIPLSPHRRSAGDLIVLSALLLFSGGCGAGERVEAELAADLFARPVNVSVNRVVDAGALPGEDAAQPIGQPQRLFSFGRRDGDERFLFGEIADMVLSATGDTVYVLDRMNREVKALSSDGRFLYRFGRQGKGPGEYEDPASITLLPWNGNLAVWDATLQRLTILTTAGEVVHTASPFRQSEMAKQGKKLRAYRDGFVLEARSDPYTVDPAQQRGHLVRLDTLGGVRDTLVGFAIPYADGSTVEGPQGRISSMVLFAPVWTPNPEWDITPDGHVAFAPGGRYEVFRLDGTGGAELKITRPLEPARVTKRDRLANLRYAQERGWITKDIPLFVLEAAHRKTFTVVRPTLTGVLFDDRGGVWTRRFDTDDDGNKGLARTWDGYRPDGAPAATARFERGFLPLAIRGGVVYGIRRDLLDVDRLEAYRL